MKKKYLITGGSGFIGTNLVEFYKDKGEVLNIDILSPRNEAHKPFWKKVDLLDESSLIKAFIDFKPDYVLHMGARTDLDGQSLEDYKANTIGVENVIKAINQTHSIKKTIFASSRLVCEIGYDPKDEFDYKPSTIYGESKIIGEKIVRESQLLNDNWILLRPTSLWGPWFDIPYKTFFDTIKKRLYFHPKGLNIYKKFGFVQNSVYIIDKLLSDNTLNKQTHYLCDFDSLEVGKWANLISEYYYGKKISEVPFIFLKLVAFGGDMLKFMGYKHPPLTSFRLNNLITPMDFNTSAIELVVSELPYSLEQGTKITLEWLNNK